MNEKDCVRWVVVTLPSLLRVIQYAKLRTPTLVTGLIQQLVFGHLEESLLVEVCKEPGAGTKAVFFTFVKCSKVR